jgi:rhodanese-related sulfurtransferase
VLDGRLGRVERVEGSIREDAVTFDPPEDEEPQGRWKRNRSGEPESHAGRIALLIVGALLLIAAGVAVFAGRPIAFYIVHRQTARKFPDIRWIDASTLVSWRSDRSRPQPVILDARTETEYSVSHMADAARIDPYRPLLRPLKGLPLSTPIVVYSSVGYRGARVAYWLGRQGFTNVQNLDGGIFRWANEGRPLFRQGAETVETHPYQPRWGLMLESSHRIAAPPLEKRSAAP